MAKIYNLIQKKYISNSNYGDIFIENMVYLQKIPMTMLNENFLSVPLHPLFKNIYGKTD